jgi:hypothetical protein
MRRFAINASTETRWKAGSGRQSGTGAVGFWEGAFPRYVWYNHEGTVYEARLVNHETGEYKGYPLAADEWPPGLITSDD